MVSRFTHNLVSVFLLLVSIGWVIYTIFSSWGTEGFNWFNAYATILILLFDLIWNELVKSAKVEG